ncbi:MAG: PaaI family thioesterase [Deltaproteobacteria bacterium]|nr:PaaI family thioesterase [Deltaproteobacteria bacterium]
MDKANIDKRAAALIALFASAPIKATTGMELSYEDGRAIFEMPYNPGFDHAVGGIHGGAICTLLDNAGWFTAALQYDVWIATVDLNVKILEPASQEGLRAEGRLLRSGKRLAMAEMELRSASDGRLVATGSGTFAVTSISRQAKR